MIMWVMDRQHYDQIKTSENITRDMSTVDIQSVNVCITNSNKCTRTLLQVYMARDLVFLPSQNLGLTAWSRSFAINKNFPSLWPSVNVTLNKVYCNIIIPPFINLSTLSHYFTHNQLLFLHPSATNSYNPNLYHSLFTTTILYRYIKQISILTHLPYICKSINILQSFIVLTLFHYFIKIACKPKWKY
jgi:hypothetical protein